jgi:biopolymer transport protein ExbD
VYYKIEKPKSGVIVYFDKNNEIWVNGLIIKKDKLKNFLNEFVNDKSSNYMFCFSKDISFGSYIQDKIFIQTLKIVTKEEFIF